MTLGRMRWSNVVFLHWDVSPDAVASWVPSWLTLEIRRRRAFVGVVALHAVGPVPPMPAGLLRRMPVYPQVNVRTYVNGPAGPGILIRRTSVGSFLAAAGARLLGQPYVPERAHVDAEGERVEIESAPISFAGEATHDAPPALAQEIERDLLERYVVYGELPGGIPYHVSVRHRPWLVRRMSVDLCEPRIAEVEGRQPGGVLYAEPVDVAIAGFSPQGSLIRQAVEARAGI